MGAYRVQAEFRGALFAVERQDIGNGLVISDRSVPYFPTGRGVDVVRPVRTHPFRHGGTRGHANHLPFRLTSPETAHP